LLEDGRLSVDIAVRKLAGHKVPCAHPSRRAWLHLTAPDGSGNVLFESGAFRREGAFGGNDNDEDGTRYMIQVGDAHGPVRVEEELLYQPIGFRWAQNLGEFPSAESARFRGMFVGVPSTSATLMARGEVIVRE